MDGVLTRPISEDIGGFLSVDVHSFVSLSSSSLEQANAAVAASVSTQQLADRVVRTLSSTQADFTAKLKALPDYWPGIGKVKIFPGNSAALSISYGAVACFGCFGSPTAS